MKSKVLHNVFARLANTFSEAEGMAGDGEKTPPGAPSANNGAHVNGEVFGARVANAIRARTPSAAGKFQVMRLNRISDAFGDRWPAIQERVMQVAERVLHKRLTRVDCFSRADDCSFVVLFVELTEEQARFKAKSIAEEIQGIVLGEVDNGPNIGVSAAVADVERLALPDPVTGADLSLALEAEIASGGEAPITQNKLVGDVEITYRPTLNVAAGYVAIFDTAPSRQVGTRSCSGKAFFPGGSGELNLRMNLEVICRTMVDVHMAAAAGRKFAAVLPIHFQAIGSRYRHELIEVLKTIDQETRRRLIFDIIGCEPGTPSMRLSDVVSALTPFSRAVTLRLDIDYPQIAALSNLGLAGAGIDLGDREVDAVDINQLVAFVRRVRTINLRPYVYGVRSADMIPVLAEMGVSYINGPAVTPSTRTIGTLVPYSRALPPSRPITELVRGSGASPLKFAAGQSASGRPATERS